MENKIEYVHHNKLVCLTPVRNEAWILHAFLKATSLWADIIIIADQGSTDGSREIALQYPKVKLIDNALIEMNQAQTRKMLFAEAKKIQGNKVLFALDADEFLSGDFKNTESWQNIINANLGDVFYFRWINLLDEKDKCIVTKNWMQWVSCVDTNDNDTIFPDNYIHEWRLPFPKNNTNEIYVDDIYFIHFARVSANRQINKNRFYQVITKSKKPEISIVNLYRMYHIDNYEEKSTIDKRIYSFYSENGLNLNDEIDFTDSGSYYNKAVIDFFLRFKVKTFSGLDIWQKDFLDANKLDDPRTKAVKLLHLYLKFTQKVYRVIFVRLIDKLIKKFGV